MKITLKKAFGALAASLAMAGAAQAAVLNPTVVTEQSVFSFDNSGFFGDVMASATLWNLSTTNGSFWAFCVDPVNTLNQHANAYVAGAFTDSKDMDNVRRLYNAFYSGVSANDANYNAAFQVALWEFNNDTGHDLTTGNLNFSAGEISGDPTVLGLANTMVNAVNAQDAAHASIANLYNFTAFNSRSPLSQGLLAVTPVPEASEWGMMSAGLGLLALMRRRKAK